jgi:hypothetical protein
MSLFDWFQREPSRLTVLDDVVWLSTPAKYRGIRQRVAERLVADDAPDAILLVAHFGDCECALRDVSDADQGPVRVVIANELSSARPASMSLGEAHQIEIVVGERHPLRAKDDAVAEFASGLPCRTRLVHHVSLDEPLMRAFAGEWMEGALKKMGMKEDEAIESSLVSRRINAAQQRVAENCHSDGPAASAAEWLAQNCRGVGR